jgi:hypothetical protein
MTLRKLAIALTATAGITGGAIAETIIVNDGVAVRESTVERPSRGMSMEAVEQKFGAPATRHNAVGSPPITRWDYPGFSVFFENNLVLHSVALAP